MARYSRQFILDRAQKTCAVAEAISATWAWGDMNLTDLNAARTGCEVLLDQTTGMEMAADAARGTLDMELDKLYEYAAQGIGLARAKYRNDPAKQRIVERLEAIGNSRPSKRNTVKAWAMAWSQLDAAWVLQLRDENLTLVQYQNLRKGLEGDDTGVPPMPGTYDGMEVSVQNARAKAETLNVALDDLESLMGAWYAAATTVCAAGTAEGDQIRGQIPTTYNPQNEPLPIPPVPSGLAAGPGSQPNSVDGVCLPATYAEEYIWTLTPVSGNPETNQIITNNFSVTFTDVFTLSSATLTVAARNPTGTSATSAPVPVNI